MKEIYCSKWGWCQLKLGFSPWGYCGPIAEEMEIHRQPALLLALSSSRGCFERIIRGGKSLQFSGLNAQLKGKREAGICLVPLKKEYNMPFELKTQEDFVCSQREPFMQMGRCFDPFNRVTLLFMCHMGRAITLPLKSFPSVTQGQW